MGKSRNVEDVVRRLLEDPVANANDIIKIQAKITSTTDEGSLLANLRAAKDFFEKVHREGIRRRLGPDASSADNAFQSWLKQQFSHYKASLVNLLGASASPVVQRAVLLGMMAALTYYADAQLDNTYIKEVVSAVVCDLPDGSDVLDQFVTEYLPYADVRYSTLRTLSQICEAEAAQAAEAHAADQRESSSSVPPIDFGKAKTLISNLYRILTAASAHVEDVDLKSWCAALEVDLVSPKKKRKRGPSVASEKQSLDRHEGRAVRWASPAFQQKAYSSAWLSFLQLQLPDAFLRKVLVQLHTDVMPHISNPHLLADFLARVVDHGGLLGILALHGLFVLVTKHGFEYPQFYARLYAMLEPSVFLAQHRVQFFQLVDIFLASGKVPAYTAAAFVKRFARLALSIPPAGALIALGFIHNLLRRHPALQSLVDRAVQAGEAASAGCDVFQADMVDLTQCRAHESSLWEVETLTNHYCPEVALAAAALLAKDMTDKKKTSEVDCSRLFDGSYGSMVLLEGKRRLKSIPTSFFSALPSTLGPACATPHLMWSQ